MNQNALGIELDGEPLSPAVLRLVLDQPVRPVLSETVRRRLRGGRAALEAAAVRGQPIYGMTTGVGAMKYTSHSGDALSVFNQSLAFAHEIAVGEPVPAGVARLAVVLRLNTVASGQVGVSEAFADQLAEMLRLDMLPVMTRRGSVGCGDLGQLGQLATAMTGYGRIRWQGRVMPAADALRAAGLSPYQMLPREGLAAVGSNAYGLSSAVSAVLAVNDRIRQALAQAPVTALAWGLDREVWRTALASRNPTEADVARFLVEATAAQSTWPARTSVHDALSGRFLVQILSPCIVAGLEAVDALVAATGQVDDNPVVRADGSLATSGASHHGFLALRLTALQFAASQLGRNLLNHCLMLANGQLPGLPVNLVPTGAIGTGYGPLIKLAMEQNCRIQAAASPVPSFSVTLAAGLEDEALLLPLIGEHLAEQAEALGWLLTVCALLSVQSIAIRDIQPAGLAGEVTRLVRRHFAPLSADVPLSEPLSALRALLDEAAARGDLRSLAPFRPCDDVLYPPLPEPVPVAMEETTEPTAA